MPAASPALVTPAQFSRGGFAPRQTVVIHLDQKQYEGLIRGLKPQIGPPDRVSGLWVIPVPGRPDYVAFPICWPDEAPHVDRNGNVRCVPTDFGDKPPPKVPVPSSCSWSLSFDANGRPRFKCEGRCSHGGRCRFSGYWNVGFGTLLGCRCPAVSIPPHLGGVSVGAGSASASSASSRKRARTKK